jgi:hypothetical protein
MMILKGYGRKHSWLNFMVLFQHSPGGLRKTTNTLNQDSQSLGRNLKPGPSEYEAGVLTTVPRLSVVCS